MRASFLLWNAQRRLIEGKVVTFLLLSPLSRQKARQVNKGPLPQAGKEPRLWRPCKARKGSNSASLYFRKISMLEAVAEEDVVFCIV